jgi:hypothetical protein
MVCALIYYWGGKWFPSFFCLPIIALATISVPVLCVIQYCLSYNSNNGDIWNGRVRGKGKQRRERNKTKQKTAEEINWER